ncbi:ATP12-domain-containing protein [Parathielavia appendiculata]|uniref:ATP12-domain-containing protein n=1 Tax=Parathielavia appendiculata TaxID=2587402 RepID=A0AAN6U1T0_9PEZI|nr:ATP12-domain-containing protein [Parathielavia appendiculata]
MSPATRLCLVLPLRPVACRVAGGCTRAATRAIHSNPAQPAKVVPVYGTGPPPEPPQPDPEFTAQEREQRLARRRRQAELLNRAGDLKALKQQQQQDAKNTKTSGGGLKRRFWKDVHVREVNGALEIHLDTRPLRHPTTKSIIRLPASKPHLAHALALEWDNLVSAQQATKQHLIPLTSLICRALDIASSDSSNTTEGSIRPTITTTLLRYLDTDSLLCLAPPPAPGDHDPARDGPSLRTRQEQAYTSTVSYLTTRVWPGVSIAPVLDGHSLFPQPQQPGTREVVQGWITSLSPFELAGLERATLAGKSLLAAARLVVEWSEEGAHARTISADEERGRRKERYGVEEAARAVSLEVDWQTGRWGEVEDTHDVEKEDLRRQLGSVVLLVSGNGTASKSS